MFLFYLTKKFNDFFENKLIPFFFGDFEDQEGICCCERNFTILTLPFYIIVLIPILAIDLATLPIKTPFIIYRYCKYKKCS